MTISELNEKIYALAQQIEEANTQLNAYVAERDQLRIANADSYMRTEKWEFWWNPDEPDNEEYYELLQTAGQLDDVLTTEDFLLSKLGVANRKELKNLLETQLADWLAARSDQSNFISFLVSIKGDGATISPNS